MTDTYFECVTSDTGNNLIVGGVGHTAPDTYTLITYINTDTSIKWQIGFSDYANG